MNHLILAAALAFAPGLAAAAPVILSFGSDTDFIAFESTPGYTNVGNASTLWGNAGPSGNFEYAIRGTTDSVVVAQGQIDWASGDHALGQNRAGDAYVAYAASGAISFNFAVNEIGNSPNGDPSGDYGLAGTIGTGVNAMFFRARGPASGTANANLQGITVNYGANSIDLGDLFSDGDANYVGLIDADLASGFTVLIDGGAFNFGTGTAGAVPALQVKFGTAVIDTPAPAALGLFGLGLLALAARRRA